jgi:hypothetical protein
MESAGSTAAAPPHRGTFAAAICHLRASHQRATVPRGFVRAQRETVSLSTAPVHGTRTVHTSLGARAESSPANALVYTGRSAMCIPEDYPEDEYATPDWLRPGSADHGGHGVTAVGTAGESAAEGRLVVERMPITYEGYTYPHGHIAYIEGAGPKPVVLVHPNCASPFGLASFSQTCSKPDKPSRRRWAEAVRHRPVLLPGAVRLCSDVRRPLPRDRAVRLRGPQPAAQPPRGHRHPPRAEQGPARGRSPPRRRGLHVHERRASAPEALARPHEGQPRDGVGPPSSRERSGSRHRLLLWRPGAV